MISALACVDGKSDKAVMRDAIQELAAKLTEDEWVVRCYDTVRDAEQYISAGPLVDLACCDVTREAALEWTKRFRKEYRGAKIMLVADAAIPPTKYLRPDIMASALLLKPYSREQMMLVMEEFIRSYLDDNVDESESFVIIRKEGRTVIPYDRIYYLEAREKRVYLRTIREEYAVNGALEALQNRLPDYFIKTHRSFVVNSRKIEEVNLTEHMVKLRDEFSVPLSRSCREKLKEYLK